MFGKVIPTWWWLVAIGALVALLGASHMNTMREKNRFSTYKADAESLARKAADAQRTREIDWQDRFNKVGDHASNQIRSLSADLDRSRAGADSLQRAADRAASRAASCAAAGQRSQSKPSADPGRLLADVLAEASARLRSVDEYADRLRIAGSACEASADALTDTR